MGHIYFTGLMGCGKSSLGRAVAARLHRPFYDLDQRISDHFGKTIAELIAEIGWENFRQQELEILRSLATEPQGVVALGGGTVTIPGAMEFILQTGISIYLDVPLSTLSQRIIGKSKRPLVAACKSVEEVQDILRKLWDDRKKFYRLCTLRIVVPNNQNRSLTVSRMAKAILELESYQSESKSSK